MTRIANKHGRYWDSQFDPLVEQCHLESTGLVSKSEPFTVVSKDGQPLFGRHVLGVNTDKVFVSTRWN